jgi:dienelactone hydrolase
MGARTEGQQPVGREARAGHARAWPGLALGLVLALTAAAGCQPSTASAGSSAGPLPASFEVDVARDPRDLQVAVRPLPRPAREQVVAEQVTFASLEWASGLPRTIRLHGYLVRPVEQRPGERRPGVIVAHGLGGEADVDTAVSIAQGVDAVALVISAPGLGKSQGRAITFDDATALYDPGGDVRKSWLYAYTYGLLRAVTFLSQRPDVDPQGIVVTGNSMGAVASFIANGVDDRIQGILPMSGGGALAEGAAAGSWMARLFHQATGRQAGDAQVTAYFAALDPLAFADRQHGAVYMQTGAQDEFFPMPQQLATFNRLRGPARSLALVPDYDHQWYFGTGCPAACMPGAPTGVRRPASCPATCPRACPAGQRWPYCGPHASYNRHDETMARWGYLLRALVSQQARHPRGPFGPPPPAPVVNRDGDTIQVHVGGTEPRAVRLAISDNGGFTWGQFAVLPDRRGRYLHRHPGLAPGALLFAEIEAADGTVVTSTPTLPRGFRPSIRPFETLASH